MSDDRVPEPTDEETRDSTTREIEALLAELDVDDLDTTTVPDDVWAGIEQRVADAPNPVTAIASRRRHTIVWLAAAAAVVLVIAATVVMVGGGSDGRVVSAAVLSFDPAAFDPRGADATARAQLVDRDGHFEIRLTDADLPALDDEDLELWLIEPDAEGNPVDVAPVARVEGTGAYQLPAGLDPFSHFVVDISIEPRDGDATHSGQSILRGALEPA